MSSLRTQPHTKEPSVGRDHVTSFAIAVPGASGLLGLVSAAVTGLQRLRYMGASLYNTTAANGVAHVRIREGSVTGKILDDFFLGGNNAVGCDKQVYYELGIWCEGDIYVELVAGTVEGSIRWA